jgi:hypothetical protein
MFHRELVRPGGYPIHTFTWTEAIAHLDDFRATNFRHRRDFVAAHFEHLMLRRLRCCRKVS